MRFTHLLSCNRKLLELSYYEGFVFKVIEFMDRVHS
jgi:hypothetical protein